MRRHAEAGIEAARAQYGAALPDGVHVREAHPDELAEWEDARLGAHMRKQLVSGSVMHDVAIRPGIPVAGLVTSHELAHAALRSPLVSKKAVDSVYGAVAKTGEFRAFNHLVETQYGADAAREEWVARAMSWNALQSSGEQVLAHSRKQSPFSSR